MTNSRTICPGTQAALARPVPFSPLGWSMWGRLAVAAGACAALWAVVLWALD